MSLKVTVLGSGGSDGVPRIGCSCYVCSSTNPKDKRLRPSILIEKNGKKILIDCGPDFREQALKNNISFVDAVIITHTHADHIMGIHELKQAHNKYKPTPVYIHENDFQTFQEIFSFTFNPTDKIYYKFTKPFLFKDYEEISIDGVTLQTIVQLHGKIQSQGIIIDNFAYCTDVNGFSEKSIAMLKGIDTMILDCLRPSFSPSHFGIDAMLEFIQQIQPKQVYLTHINHDISHDEFSRILPSNVAPCYDGLEIFIK